MLRIRTAVRIFRTRRKGSPVMPERATEAQDEVLSEQELREMRERRLRDPGVQARAREVLKEIERDDEPKNPGIKAEDLPDFLREHGG